MNLKERICWQICTNISLHSYLIHFFTLQTWSIQLHQKQALNGNFVKLISTDFAFQLEHFSTTTFNMLRLTMPFTETTTHNTEPTLIPSKPHHIDESKNWQTTHNDCLIRNDETIMNNALLVISHVSSCWIILNMNTDFITVVVNDASKLEQTGKCIQYHALDEPSNGKNIHFGVFFSAECKGNFINITNLQLLW